MVSSRPQAPRNNQSIDPYVLLEALAGRRLEQASLPSRSVGEEYDDLRDIKQFRSGKMDEPNPDPQPDDVFVGCINPFALAENMIGHKIDRQSTAAIRILEDTLQTDYEELFDMKHHSVLYAGLKLNENERMAEELDEKETKILKEKDLVTPDVSRLDKLGDLEEIGIKEMDNLRIKRAGIFNNKLHLVLHANSIARTVCNREVTQTMNDFCLPFRRGEKQMQSFTPPNSSWRDARDVFVMPRRMIAGYSNFFDYSGSREYQHLRRFDDPIQGATGNSWFIAALFSVYWADPAMINRNTNMETHMYPGSSDEERRRQQHFRVKFHDKGGRNNNRTMTVEVDYHIPVNNSSEDPVYCRASDGKALWPSLYEKAFAKWIANGNNGGDDDDEGSTSKSPNNNNNFNREVAGYMNALRNMQVAMGGERVDITQTHHGDPVKAMAQINGREPQYYFTSSHSGRDLVGLVRGCSVNQRTICPMVAWTHATAKNNNNNNGGDEQRGQRQGQGQGQRGGENIYRGCDLVANHAYSVLGWCSVGQGDKQYIVVRNPWGVSEPHGITSYPGILTRLESEFWRPAALLDREGVMAVEVAAFKEYFACMGIAK